MGKAFCGLRKWVGSFFSLKVLSQQDKAQPSGREGRRRAFSLQVWGSDWGCSLVPRKSQLHSCQALPRHFLRHGGPPLLQASLPMWTDFIYPNILRVKAKVPWEEGHRFLFSKEETLPVVPAAHNDILFCPGPQENGNWATGTLFAAETLYLVQCLAHGTQTSIYWWTFSENTGWSWPMSGSLFIM